MKDLRGKVAVVTGGASGIGLGMCERFAAEGMKLVLADVESARLEAETKRLAQEGAEAIGIGGVEPALHDLDIFRQLLQFAHSAVVTQHDRRRRHHLVERIDQQRRQYFHASRVDL